MDDIVDERYEWEMFGEEELFGARPLRCAAGEVDWQLMEELLTIECGDAPALPAYPMVVETDGKSM